MVRVTQKVPTECKRVDGYTYLLAMEHKLGKPFWGRKKQYPNTTQKRKGCLQGTTTETNDGRAPAVPAGAHTKETNSINTKGV